MIFDLFNVKNIDDFNKKISLLKNKADLADDLRSLKIDLDKDYNKIIKGVNLLRLGNNPVKIEEKDIYNIFQKNYFNK